MATSDEVAATFCCDHYAHPLLWCEEKKRRKAAEVARKEKEKQEYYESCLQHCPWGRPGGGAPNRDVRRKDITALGLHSTPAINGAHRISSLQPYRYGDYFIQRKKCKDPIVAYHHRHKDVHPVSQITIHSNNISDAPANATEPAVRFCDSNATDPVSAGKNVESLRITLKDHPSLSRRSKGHVDIEVRYKSNATGKPLLKKIVVTEKDSCPVPSPTAVKETHEERRGKNKPEKLCWNVSKPQPTKDSWDRAGPDGKSWRSPTAVGSSFMKSLGWTNKEMLKELDQDNPATPAEKHTFRRVRPTKKLQRCCEFCVCQCPAMITSTLKPLRRKPVDKVSISTVDQSSKPKLCTRFQRHCAAASNVETTTDASAIATVGGGVELVPLLARRRAINRPISLSSTDVTRRDTSNDRTRTSVADPRYLHDLGSQVSQKRRSTSMAQQFEQDLSSKHFETFDSFWGRPGHGAPSEIKTKFNLDNLLYGAQTRSG